MFRSIDESPRHKDSLAWFVPDNMVGRAAAFLESVINKNKTGNKLTYFIKSGDDIIGLIDCKIIEENGVSKGHIGYFSNPDKRRAGAITQALIALSDQLIDKGITPTLEIVEINAQSIAVANKAGFKEIARTSQKLIFKK